MDLHKDTQLVSVNPCSEHSAQIALLFFFFFFNNFYLSVFGSWLLHRLTSSFGERGLLTVVAFLVEQGLRAQAQ